MFVKEGEGLGKLKNLQELVEPAIN